ncbi:MAG: response regulator transcription factor [Defluviitaleaceae bacterium]|nr:response regulator transcription factor [Defluviitaleaceae bacterium]
MNTRILVVDDEPRIVDILAFNLKKEGYEVLTAHDGEAGLELALKEEPDLILLDIMMPKMDGYEVCKRVREVSQVPIIMLTARADETDKVVSFDLGADDYVVKPFGVRELMSRVMANLRRRGVEIKKEAATGGRLTFGELVVDLDMFEARRNGELIDLTRREFEVVRFLATQNTQVFSREALLKEVWGFEFFGDVRTVDVTIRRLRTKLEPSPEVPTYVLTKRGVGYHFTTEFGDGTGQ